jgi:pimeloyl-ACP methyl ester carboxylesterase
MASMFPEKIGGLVLCGAPLLFRDERQTRKPALRYRIVRWATRKKLIKPDRLEKMKHESGSSDYRSATGVMRDSLVKIVNESYEDELRRISCPVWLVWGAKDAEVPLSIAKRARALISSQTTLLVEPEAGHLLPVTHPAILRNALAVAKGTTHDAS